MARVNKAFVLFLALSAVPLCAQTAPPVGIYVAFDSVPASSSVRLMQKEVERLMRPSGLNLNWRWLAENRGIEVFSGLVVLRFKGQCSGELPTDESGVEDKSTALASSEVLRGHVLPFSEVRCDEVRKALLYLQPGANRIERQQALGLALGRVVAHELYHMLAQTTEHSRTGLSKPSQSLPELISPHEVDFRERDSRAIRNGFLR